MNHNVLVTGGNGQLGCSIKKVSEKYPNWNFLFTDIPEADITNYETIKQLVLSHKIDVIVNCAAYTAVDKAESDELLAAKINVAGPANLAKISKELGIKLLHVSTDYVFNGNGYIPLKEEDATSPIGVYGRTKLDGENAISAAECDALVVRTAWLYSEFGANFVKTMLRLSETKPELGVIFDQVGTPTYAPDLAEALLQIIDKGFTGFAVYHYSNEGVCSWYDFAKEIFAISNRLVKVSPLETWQYPTPAKRPHYSVFNKTKIKNTFSIEIPYWKDSLKICINALN